MVLLVTAEELASHLQRDLDRASATQAIETASGWVESQTGWAFSPRTAELRLPPTYDIHLPVPVRKPLRSVDAIVINGVPVTGWSLTLGAVSRPGGWHYGGPAQPIDITVSFGMDACPTDVKGLIYELAAAILDNPTRLSSAQTSTVSETYRDELSPMSLATLTAYGARAPGVTPAR